MSYETEIFRPTHHPALRRKRFTRRDSWITDPEIEPSDPPTSPFGDNFLSIPQITEDMDDIPTVLDKLRDITAILSRLNWPVPNPDGTAPTVILSGGVDTTPATYVATNIQVMAHDANGDPIWYDVAECS